MFATLPTAVSDFRDWDWAKIAPYFDDLEARPLGADSVDGWLRDWTHLHELITETYTRAEVATTLDTTDKAAEEFFNHYLEQILEPGRAAEQKLKEKLLASGLAPDGFAIPLRNMRAEADLFRAANLPLLTEEEKLGLEYDRLIGAQTVEWEGEERTLVQLRPLLQDADRARRERAWRLSAERQLADRAAINANWEKLFALRVQLAANADLPDYRAYAWQMRLRFAYTPDDCLRFHDAIEQVVVPAAERVYARRRERLGYDTLRPWDLEVDPLGRAPLRPFKTVDKLESGIESIFQQVDPALGGYFQTMRGEGLLDLENRKGKAPGGYCTDFAYIRRPFVFMNAVGVHDDVQTMLHEGGHAFHIFESAHLPYAQQAEVPIEFAEVASMAMELLAAPYLTTAHGGFYDEADAARARIEKLEEMLTFWPYMAVVDALQHWIYTSGAGGDPAQIDAKWAELWGRFMRGVDWSGLDDVLMTGWQRKLHIHQVPFYYVEYGIAQVGAVQVWRSSLTDQAGAVANYRRGLALGGTAALPDLFSAAGAALSLDAATLGAAVDLIEREIERLS
jgi:oligoendopeptidase F